jgi:N-acetylglucosaminyldiphosphoundecaprenol N-acetyl-beta-D-mannosaminyltransferase
VNEPLTVWGIPFSALSLEQTVDRVAELVTAGVPSFVITANVNYAMLLHKNPRLRDVNERAGVIVADGAPLVWASRLRGTPLPERVAGSDLIFSVCERAARAGFRVFLLGGAEAVAAQAANNLTGRYPGLNIVGIESPPYRPLSPEENQALIDRVRSTKPDLLFAFFSQPRGEIWLSENTEALGVPVCLQVGAAIDFAAGRVRRAPVWVQNAGLEWAFRTWLEPARLGPRYARNAAFVLRQFARDLAWVARGGRGRGASSSALARTIP